MSTRETDGRKINSGRGRVAAPVRFFNSNPEALTLRDIPQVLKPGEKADVAKPHFAAPQPPQFAPQTTAQPQPQPVTPVDDEPTVDIEMLARQRTALGFDDIPIVSAEELQNEKDLREKVSSWAKGAYQHGLSPEKRQRVTKFIKNKEFLAWKDDLKWALKADKGDEPIESLEAIKPVEVATQQLPQAPLNVTADPTQPRPVRVPQRGTQFAAGLRAQTRLQQQMPQPMAPAAVAGNKSIDINISFGSLPKLPKLPKLPSIKPLLSDLRHLKWNRRTQITSGITIILLLFVAPHFLPGDAKKAATADANGTVKTQQLAQKPDYNTVVPASTSSDQVAWKRVSPPGGNAVFAYADKIGSTAINVSQQPIPDSFKSDIDGSVATLAKSYNATEKIIAGTTAIYVGTSGDGPQSAIFTKNNLLILVKSTDKISESDWAKYAESLR